jgi:hypothetical protein
MRCGHADAQFMFAQIGRALGFEVRQTWTRELPTDGVWLFSGTGMVLPMAPAVALEVAVSEGPKALKGSIDTLAEVSPALGVLMIDDAEIRRGMLRDGIAAEVIDNRLAARFDLVHNRISRSQQRIEIWNYSTLRFKYRLATGRHAPETLARTATP